jgi:hypothetical protein
MMSNISANQCKDHDSISASRFVEVGRQLQDEQEGLAPCGNLPTSSSATSSLTFPEERALLQNQSAMKCSSKCPGTAGTDGKDERTRSILGSLLTMISCAGLSRTIPIRKTTIVAVLSALIAISLPYLVYLTFLHIEVDRTLVLFETKFGCIAVRSIATLTHCEMYEENGRNVYDWYE